MGTAERREREKLRRRTDIIDSAENVFFSKGFENSTMDDVASEAELSKGTLYLYFKSKEELYLEIVHRATKILSGLFLEAVKNKVTGLEKTKAIGEGFIKFNKEYPNYHDAFLYHQTKEYDEKLSVDLESSVFGVKRQSMEIFVDAIESGIKDGSIRENLDPVKTAVLLWGETTGILMLIKYKGKLLKQNLNLSEEELISYFFEFTYQALKAN